MQTERGRNCTQMEFFHCYMKEDPILDRKSTRDFKVLNQAAKQSAFESSMCFAHRTAYPNVLCDPPRTSSDFTEEDDVDNLLAKDAKKRPFTPMPGNTLKHIGHTETQTTHNVKVPFKTVPVTTSEFIDYTNLTMEQKHELDDLKKVPYDAQCKEALGKLNSLYRTDFGKGADSERCGAFKVQRPLELPFADPGAAPEPRFNKHDIRLNNGLHKELDRASENTGSLMKRFDHLSTTTPRIPPTEYGRKSEFVPFSRKLKEKEAATTTRNISKRPATAGPTPGRPRSLTPRAQQAATKELTAEAPHLPMPPPQPAAPAVHDYDELAVVAVPAVPDKDELAVAAAPDALPEEAATDAAPAPKAVASNLMPQPPSKFSGKTVRPNTARVASNRIPKSQPCPATFAEGHISNEGLISTSPRPSGRRIVSNPKRAFAAAAAPGLYKPKKGTVTNSFCAATNNKKYIELSRTFFAKRAGKYQPYTARAAKENYTARAMSERIR